MRKKIGKNYLRSCSQASSTKRAREKIFLWIVLGLFLFASPSTFADKKAATREQTAEDLEEAEEKRNEFLPEWQLGGDFRFRSNFDHARQLDKEDPDQERILQRYRMRLWSKFYPTEKLKLTTRLISEPRYYCQPDLADPFTREEALFDRLNLEIQDLFDFPITARIGRQGMQPGSGWLLFDGSPRDGTRTYFFDAARLRTVLSEWDTTVDLIWVENHADSAKWIKPFNDQDLDLIEQDEQGAILYVSNSSWENTTVDGYFMYKHDHHRARQSGSEGEIYTLGWMIEGTIDSHWSYYLEAAPQFGHKNGKTLQAFGWNSQLSYHFRDSAQTHTYLGFEYLSGDKDPDKNFDKVWGRYAQWNNIYTGTIDGLDGRYFDSSNLYRLTIGWYQEPWEKIAIEAGYHLLFADENTMDAGSNGLSEDGRVRGHTLTTALSYRFSEHVSTRMNVEFFFPGDFYDSTRNDVASYLRYEVLLKW